MLGENSGSCKLFFAEIQNLSEQATLSCFGAYYQEDVLGDLDGKSQNIRNFMKTGWDGIAFYGEALELKKII
jgi:hypothetical protein